MQHLTIRHGHGGDRRVGHWMLALGLCAIALATLTPAGEQNTESIFACVFCGEQWLADVLRNALLYIPLGLGLGLAGIRPRRAVLLGALLSAAVEVVQIVLPGRDSSLGDVLANTGGTAIGVLLLLSAPVWFRPSHKASGILALCWSLGVSGIWALTGWLLAPSFPTTVYYGQWTPNLGYIDWYRGRVLDARIGDGGVRSRRIPDSDAVRRALLRGDPISLRFVAGPNTPDLSSIFSIYDDRQREIVLIGPRGNDLVVRYATRAARFGLDQPELRLQGIAAGWSVGDTVTLSVHRAAPGWVIQTGGAPGQALGYSISAGWTLLFYPGSQRDWLLATLGVAWMAALLVPVGYWLRRTRCSAVAIGVGVLAAAVTPRVVGLLGTPPASWMAMALGLLLGAAAWRVAAPSLPTDPVRGQES